MKLWEKLVIFILKTIGITVGGAGVIGKYYISYNQFKKDFTEYFDNINNILKKINFTFY